jgi:hypothetical protein
MPAIALRKFCKRKCGENKREGNKTLTQKPLF